MATEELKLLSSIIGRIESAIYEKQGWLFTLITGLTLALLKDHPLLSKGHFALISVLITLIFLFADIVQRIPAQQAIERSKVIEQFLSRKEAATYDGPDISGSLGQDIGIKAAWTSISFGIRVWFPYLAIGLIIGIICVISP